MPLIAGALTVLGFAPFSLWPVPIATLAVLFHAWQGASTPRQAWLSGYAFGLGCFLTGVSWMYVSLHEFGSMPSVLAALAVFFVCAYLALFPALAGWLVLRFGGTRPGPRLALMAAAFVAFEWLRGWLFSGFPWLTTGTSQIPSSPLAGFAPLVGAYGTSLAVALAAALVVAFFESLRLSRTRYALLAALAVLFIAGGITRTVAWSEPSGPPVTVALLQGNVSQHLKWREEVRAQTLVDYRDMIYAARARVVVLPETALPAFLDELPRDYVEGIREHARAQGKSVLMGAVEREFKGPGVFEYYNSLLNFTDPSQDGYRKRHLVPFGEYIPPGFRWILNWLKIPLSDFGRPSGDPHVVLAAGHRFGAAICYEDVFGEEVIQLLPGADILVNVSNDAWFGESWAAEQHLQSSQMRALETGRWMVRATNTGVTAAIDERGRVVAKLPQFTRATLVQSVPPMSGATPYARWGNYAAIVLIALLAVSALASSRRAR